MSSDDYHNKKGTYSSSQLKKMNEDPEVFYKLYIAKTMEKETNSVFDLGTYFHTAILEPKKLKSECAVYSGIRRGKEWEKFQVDNAGKAIITEGEMSQATALIDAVKNSPIAMARIERGRPEVSAFVDVIVSGGEVFTLDGRVLGQYGWESAKGRTPSKKSQVLLPLKVRADLLAEDFILDLKSTTGNTKNEFMMKSVVSKYCYELSASLYLDLFSIATGKVISEFVWTFASKDVGNCKSYIASADNIRIGRTKYRKALISLAGYIQAGWAFEDSMGILEPQLFEREHLKIKGEDLL